MRAKCATISATIKMAIKSISTPRGSVYTKRYICLIRESALTKQLAFYMQWITIARR